MELELAACTTLQPIPFRHSDILEEEKCAVARKVLRGTGVNNANSRRLRRLFRQHPHYANHATVVLRERMAIHCCATRRPGNVAVNQTRLVADVTCASQAPTDSTPFTAMGALHAIVKLETP